MVDLPRDEHGNLHARLLDAVKGRSGTVYAGWLKDEVRHRDPQDTHGRRGHKADPLNRIRRT